MPAPIDTLAKPWYCANSAPASATRPLASTRPSVAIHPVSSPSARAACGVSAGGPQREAEVGAKEPREHPDAEQHEHREHQQRRERGRPGRRCPPRIDGLRQAQGVPHLLGRLRKGPRRGERAVPATHGSKLDGVEPGGDQDAAEQGVDPEHQGDESRGRSRQPAGGRRRDGGDERVDSARRAVPPPRRRPARRSRRW